jgi:hypothetical protein
MQARRPKSTPSRGPKNRNARASSTGGTGPNQYAMSR